MEGMWKQTTHQINSWTRGIYRLPRVVRRRFFHGLEDEMRVVGASIIPIVCYRPRFASKLCINSKLER